MCYSLTTHYVSLQPQQWQSQRPLQSSVQSVAMRRVFDMLVLRHRYELDLRSKKEVPAALVWTHTRRGFHVKISLIVVKLKADTR